jgi:DNA-directed RNA polymerase subunit RPC12/RpoP
MESYSVAITVQPNSTYRRKEEFLLQTDQLGDVSFPYILAIPYHGFSDSFDTNTNYTKATYSSIEKTTIPTMSFPVYNLNDTRTKYNTPNKTKNFIEYTNPARIDLEADTQELVLVVSSLNGEPKFTESTFEITFPSEAFLSSTNYTALSNQPSMKNEIKIEKKEKSLVGTIKVIDTKEKNLLSIRFPKDTFVIGDMGLKINHFKEQNVKVILHPDSTADLFRDNTYQFVFKNTYNNSLWDDYTIRFYEPHLQELLFYSKNYPSKIKPDHIFFSNYSPMAISWTSPVHETTLHTQEEYKVYGYILEKDGKKKFVFQHKMSGEPIEKFSVSLHFPKDIDVSKLNAEMIVPDEAYKKKVIKHTSSMDFLVYHLNKDGVIIITVDLPQGQFTSPNFLKMAYISFVNYYYHTYHFTRNLILFSLFVVGIISFMVWKKKHPKQLASFLSDTNPVSVATSSTVSFASDPAFSLADFFQKVTWTSNRLTTAWLSQNMASVRSIVSAGVYNRFRVQLELMKKEGMVNIMKDQKVLGLYVASFKDEDPIQTIHVHIKAEARDQNVPIQTSDAEKQKILSTTPLLPYEEIWSFIRSSHAKTNKGQDLYSGKCPKCGSPADLVSQTNKCEHCGSIYNNGEFDWVLSEITQVVEWSSAGSPARGINDLRKDNPTINTQMIEDRASYIFWRWIEAQVRGSIAPLRRDSMHSFTVTKKLLYDVAVGSVDLIKAEKWKAEVHIKWSAADTKGEEPFFRENTFVLILTKPNIPLVGFAEHSCETCGSPLPETDSLQCEYCGSSIPVRVNDWLLEKVD